MDYAFTPNSASSRFASWLRTYLTNQYVILRCCSPNLCKWNYLYGGLPFFKIQVNHFMAQDKPFGAKIITKCILWVRGLVLFWILRHSFLSLTDYIPYSDYIPSSWRLAGGYSFYPLLMPMSELSLSPLYFNKTQKLWVIKPRLWPRIEFFSSGGQESQRFCVIQQQPFNILFNFTPGFDISCFLSLSPSLLTCEVNGRITFNSIVPKD